MKIATDILQGKILIVADQASNVLLLERVLGAAGYPNGKQGEEIPLAARIMNICDIYDALRSKRPYKPAFDHEKAVDIITGGDGRTQPEHFDPVVLAAFKQSHEIFRDIFDTYAQ